MVAAIPGALFEVAGWAGGTDCTSSVFEVEALINAPMATPNASIAMIATAAAFAVGILKPLSASGSSDSSPSVSPGPSSTG